MTLHPRHQKVAAARKTILDSIVKAIESDSELTTAEIADILADHLRVWTGYLVSDERKP